MTLERNLELGNAARWHLAADHEAVQAAVLLACLHCFQVARPVSAAACAVLAGCCCRIPVPLLLCLDAKDDLLFLWLVSLPMCVGPHISVTDVCLWQPLLLGMRPKNAGPSPEVLTCTVLGPVWPQLAHFASAACLF